MRGRRAFAELAERGRTARSGPLRVRYLAAPGQALVGYAVAKRVGGAVDRNRIRRRIRAALSEVTTPLTSGFYVFSADSSTLAAPYPSLVKAVDNLVQNVTAGAAR